MSKVEIEYHNKETQNYLMKILGKDWIEEKGFQGKLNGIYPVAVKWHDVFEKVKSIDEQIEK